MTLSNMSTVYPSPHHPAPTITSSTHHQTELFASSKAKLGFSIDSIVGVKRERSPSPPGSPPAGRSPVRIKRSWSPVGPGTAAACSSPDDLAVSRPSALQLSPSSVSPPRPRSVSPPRHNLSPLLRHAQQPPPPAAASAHAAAAAAAAGLSPSYLEQLSSLRALYEAKGQVPLPPTHLLAPGLLQGLPGLPRAGPPSLPPFLHGLPGAGGQLPPREYPLHPWFLNRHRFPLGKIF